MTTIKTIWQWRGCRQINGTEWKAKILDPDENGKLATKLIFQVNGEKSDIP